MHSSIGRRCAPGQQASRPQGKQRAAATSLIHSTSKPSSSSAPLLWGHGGGCSPARTPSTRRPTAWGSPGCSALASEQLLPEPAAATASPSSLQQPGATATASPTTFKILFQDEHLVAIEKPSCFHVHPPEDGYPIPPGENILRLLKAQLRGTYLYPVHRLDRPTSGVLIYALTREAASGLGQASREHRIRKTYIAMCRGHAAASGKVDQPLDTADSTTLYKTLATVELPRPVGKFATARYSILEVRPLTGHFHQIRRHLNRVNHPIVGDTEHGDRAHNRFFRHELLFPGLFLKCVEMAFDHPVYGPQHPVVLQSQGQDWEPRWKLAFDMFGICPLPYYSEAE